MRPWRMGEYLICEPGEGVLEGFLHEEGPVGLVAHPGCFLQHLGKVSLLLIFHSRSVVGDDPPFLGFYKSEVC